MDLNNATLVVNKIRDNRLRWFWYVLRREETDALRVVKGMYKKDGNRKTENEVVEC